MTQDEIIEMAGHRLVSAWVIKLVCDAVDKEREACAKVCDDLYRVWTLTDEYNIEPPDALDCKRAIRARKEL